MNTSEPLSEMNIQHTPIITEKHGRKWCAKSNVSSPKKSKLTMEFTFWGDSEAQVIGKLTAFLERSEKESTKEIENV